ncbi:MAG TPA: UDP-4-amino-4,6-dideoxy-N-acetyl-beta-L-altrosamine transaminase [Rhodobiaceae bacterium]|nr:UDP-4-amino-4,6-dideoxy-N-acetyl-beta-L-altrosamine transaminase [Rhodobiaceae bacterium]
MIPYGRQNISDEDIRAVVEALTSDWLTQGPAVPRFEEALMQATTAAHAVALTNATSALHVACLAIGLGPGDILWTVPNTFVASANCGLYCGAAVDFVDIDPATRNMSVTALEKKLEDARKTGHLPRVVIPVHFAGHSCDMAAIARLSREYGFRVIEDAAHAIGGTYDGGPVGDCRYSDIAILSFHPVKIVTTGEGGAAVTQDAALADRMRLLRTHGITRDMDRLPLNAGEWYYEQRALGFNLRMTDIQAALGASQMTRLHDFVAAREALASRYDEMLSGLPLKLPPRQAHIRSAWHLYTVEIEDDDDAPESHGARRAHVFEKMRKAGIGVNVHYIPVHWQPWYREMGFHPGDFPAAEHYYRRALTLPLFPDLGHAEQDEVVAALKEALS